ncbi:MAG: hypothetical protein ACKO4Y_04375 [Flavobacteriales bacterium]
MILAGIDLGTNTFDLLIVDASKSHWKLLHQEKQWVGLGIDFFDSSCISSKAMQSATACLTQFKAKCVSMGVEKQRLVGTSALRDAVNAVEFLNALDEALNISVEIVSGEREAELVFMGLNSLTNFPDHGLIMDVGGGSTELIAFQTQTMLGLNSLNIGVTRLMAHIDINQVLTHTDVQVFEQWFNTALNLKKQHFPALIGSAGPFETFYHLLYKQSLPFRSLRELPIELLNPLLDELIYSTYKHRQTLESVPDLRKKYLHLAALQIRWVIKTFGVNHVYTCTAGLTDGIIAAQKLSEMSN